jgi:hypothetical protein
MRATLSFLPGSEQDAQLNKIFWAPTGSEVGFFLALLSDEGDPDLVAINP